MTMPTEQTDERSLLAVSKSIAAKSFITCTYRLALLNKELSFRILSTSQRCRRYSTSTCGRYASTSPRLRSNPHCPSSGGSVPRRKSYVPDRWSPQSTRACWFDSMPYLYITFNVLITFRLQRYCFGVYFLFTSASFFQN